MPKLADMFLSALGKIAMVVAVVLASPVLWVLMIFDIKRLKRTAESIEPLPDDEPPQGNSLLSWAWFWLAKYVLSPVIIAIFLPLIVLLGAIGWIVKGPDEDDGWD